MATEPLANAMANVLDGLARLFESRARAASKDALLESRHEVEIEAFLARAGTLRECAAECRMAGHHMRVPE